MATPGSNSHGGRAPGDPGARLCGHALPEEPGGVGALDVRARSRPGTALRHQPEFAEPQ